MSAPLTFRDLRPGDVAWQPSDESDPGPRRYYVKLGTGWALPFDDCEAVPVEPGDSTQGVQCLADYWSAESPASRRASNEATLLACWRQYPLTQKPHRLVRESVIHSIGWRLWPGTRFNRLCGRLLKDRLLASDVFYDDANTTRTEFSSSTPTIPTLRLTGRGLYRALSLGVITL